MKKIMLITCGILFSITLLAQPPQGINYQAVVRNSSGELVSNQSVNFRFHFRTGSAAGTIVYTETQDILTDQFGLASLVIGNGVPVSGTFETINWSGGNIWIEVEMDPDNTYTYVSMGTEQFQSVPYALYSGSDWNASGDDLYYNEGNVGIGTDAPSEKLEVVGDVFINNNDLGVEQSIFLGPSSPTVSIGREAGSRTMLLKSGVDGIKYDAGFKFQIIDSTKMTLDKDGNLGIGGRIEVFNTGQSVFIGEGAGANDDFSDNQNIAIGYQSLYSNTEGFFNTATGYVSLYDNTSGYFNTATGFSSLHDNTTGNGNTATGIESLKSNTTGFKNTAIGSQSLTGNSTGIKNTASGSMALYSNSTGNFNTAAGESSLSSNMTGNNNTALGYNADVGSGNLTNATAIGANAMVSQDNSLVLGNNANVGIGTTSPSERLHVNGNMRLEGNLYDSNNSSGVSGQVLSSTGGGGVEWDSPYPAWVAVDYANVQSYNNSDAWQTLCSVVASDFEEGHTVKLEANMMLKLTSGQDYDHFYICIKIEDSGSGITYSRTMIYTPNPEGTAHNLWSIVSLLDLHIVPGQGPITYSVTVQNTGDDPWECGNVQFIATQMD